MITVKRYNPDAAMSISREHAWMRETPEGGHVEYGDYASLFAQYESVKAERDALAVENAGFKHALSVILEHVDVTDKGPAGVVAMIANDELFNSETPATSAALAAIQAQGVEKFADDLHKTAMAMCSVKPDNTAPGAYAGLARSFAKKLREAK